MRSYILFVLILAAMVGLPACTKKDTSNHKVMLTYTRWGNPAEMESARELIAQFEKENPDIEVRVDVVGWEQYWQKIMTSTATDVAQDVWLMSSAYVEEYAAAGHIMDLVPLLQADPTFKEDDYFPSAFDPYTFVSFGDELLRVPFKLPAVESDPQTRPRLYAFTRDFNCSFLYYNRDHFDAIGLAYPTEDWTWDDLVEAAKKLTIDFNNDGVIDQWGYAGLTYGHFAGAIGAESLDLKARKSLYQSPLMLKAVTFCQDLIYKYKVHPQPRIQIDETDSFVTGKASMMIAGVWSVRSFSRSHSRWDVAPIPVDIKGRKRKVAGSGVAHSIFARTKHPKEAWRLVKFLSGDSGQRALARSGTSVPVLKSAALSDDFLAGFDRPSKNGRSIIVRTLENASSPEQFAKGYLEYTRKITDTLDGVWRNTRTPEDACRMIDKHVDEILAQRYAAEKPAAERASQ